MKHDLTSNDAIQDLRSSFRRVVLGWIRDQRTRLDKLDKIDLDTLPDDMTDQGIFGLKKNLASQDGSQ